MSVIAISKNLTPKPNCGQQFRNQEVGNFSSSFPKNLAAPRPRAVALASNLHKFSAGQLRQSSSIFSSAS